jgi:branched-chain amino acid transport system ATP-binding protein
MNSSTPLLQLSGLQAGYGEITVLWGIDLVLQQGEITALIGSNGAGKSTLMRALSGLINPTAGQMLWEGSELRGLSPAQILRHGIAHVPPTAANRRAR